MRGSANLALDGRRVTSVNSEPTIRKATTADLDSMVALLAQLFEIETDFSVDEAKQRHGLELLLGEGGRQCALVAETGSEVIGMCTAQLLVSTAEGAVKALVEDVVVAQGYRSQGVGAKLMRAMEEWAREHGAARLDLLADWRNGGALAFYERDDWQRTKLIALQKKL